ncbi:hypothetical protein I6I76_00155 [Dermacoccus nishinomiyaensis]|uniref:SRPBCC family protein n=1 Tax=Dermacoccus nishinomiyaensis TaxID=1274 RepID=UPI000E1BDCBC|nr:SRPBCC family protein [Dermacoccus nishinomiyaensis]QQY24643.1 hypothetical protein I6I76_00155 [Dermacoccus nishinomiyaensis]
MGRAGFAFRIDTALAPHEAWRRVVDVSAHGEVVPFTTGHGPAPEDAVVGSRYVARTRLGPLGFDDVMVVREIEAGRRVVFEKVGRLLGGVVTVEITPVRRAAGPDGERGLDGGAQVVWAQSITLPWVPVRLRPVAAVVTCAAAPAIGAGYRRVVTKLLDPHR